MNFLRIILFSSLLAKNGALFCNDLVEYAKTEMPNQGVLKRARNFVYVDIDDAYIWNLLPLIGEQGFVAPPYFGTEESAGAHITVIYPDELSAYGMDNLEEEGQPIAFSPQETLIVTPSRWQEIDKVYFIVVDSPELDQIRAKYGLPKRQYSFHITIGVKPKELGAPLSLPSY